MSDFVNGDRVEVRDGNAWITAIVVGESPYGSTVCAREDGESWWGSEPHTFYGFPAESVRRPRPSLEERLAELAEAAGCTSECTSWDDDDSERACPEGADCFACRSAWIHALMLAAVEEARDEER